MTAKQAARWLATKPDEMPVFVLLGSDPLAPDTVFFWVAEAEDNAVRPGKVQEARTCATQMIDYPHKQMPG